MKQQRNTSSDDAGASPTQFSKDYTPYEHLFRDRHFKQAHFELHAVIDGLRLALLQLEGIDNNATLGDRITVTDLCDIARTRLSDMDNRMEDILNLYRPIEITQEEQNYLAQVNKAKEKPEE